MEKVLLKHVSISALFPYKPKLECEEWVYKEERYEAIKSIIYKKDEVILIITKFVLDIKKMSFTQLEVKEYLELNEAKYYDNNSIHYQVYVEDGKIYAQLNEHVKIMNIKKGNYISYKKLIKQCVLKGYYKKNN